MPHNLFSRWRYSTRLLYSGCDQDVYQQDLVIHRSWGTDYEEDAGGLRVWHVFVGPRCRADYGDLRFSGGYGRELAYYLWPDHTSESARVTVRLEGADRSGALTIHYGNPSTTSTSDGDATYHFFDHFEGTILNTEKWRVAAGSWTVSDSAVRSSGSSPRLETVETVIPSLTPGWMFEIRAKHATYTDSNDVFYIRLGTTTGRYILYHWKKSGNAGELGDPTLTIPGSLSGFTWYRFSTVMAGTYAAGRTYTDSGALVGSVTGNTQTAAPSSKITLAGYGTNVCCDYIAVRAYSAAPPTLLRTSQGLNPTYLGLSRTFSIDPTIRFAGVGSVQLIGDEWYSVGGEGSFAIGTQIGSPITVASDGGIVPDTHMTLLPATVAGTGDPDLMPAALHTPIDVEHGTGAVYAAPTPVQFDIWKYQFKELRVSRSAQDALWQCEGRIVGLDAPLEYRQFEIKVPDHTGTMRTIFVGFVPGRDYIRAVGGDESIIQGYDAGFYLTRQYLPDGDLYYPAEHQWSPMNLLKYWLGEETPKAGAPSYWERITGIRPHRIHNPGTFGHAYVAKDWNFQPTTTKMQAIQEVCEHSGMAFLVKWQKVGGVQVPCAYFVHQDDIDRAYDGLDLPDVATFAHPDPHVMDSVQVTVRSDEKYNRIEVRSASPNGAWFHAIRETPALQRGDELPIEYLEERSDLPESADHGGWCHARANELYAYYTQDTHTYSLTLLNRVDLELFQRCQFYGFDAIPAGEVMRIVAISYRVLPTHSEVEISVTPDSRISDLRKLQRSQRADAVSEMQTVARDQVDRIPEGEVGTVVGIDGNEAIVEPERRTGSSIRGRIV